MSGLGIYVNCTIIKLVEVNVILSVGWKYKNVCLCVYVYLSMVPLWDLSYNHLPSEDLWGPKLSTNAGDSQCKG